MEQKFECKFCKSKFHRESSLASHLCVKKQRNLDVNTAGFRYGFRVFQRFYSLTTSTKKIKTQQEFIDSAYYIDFVKFGNHIDLLKPVYIEQYIDFVILSGLKMTKWVSDDVYNLYIENLVKTEPAASAIERSITTIMDWCDESSKEFDKFFIEVSVNEASYLIKTGRISPWILYLCSTGNNLVERFNEDHANLIGQIIDPGFWMRKFKKSDEVDYIKNLLIQAGI